jgi:hypothetical protein
VPNKNLERRVRIVSPRTELGVLVSYLSFNTRVQDNIQTTRTGAQAQQAGTHVRHEQGEVVVHPHGVLHGVSPS